MGAVPNSDLCLSQCLCNVNIFVCYQHWTYYRPQRSCSKVMFLHLSVILSTGGVCHPPRQTPPSWAETHRADTPRQTHSLGRHPPGRHPPQGDTPPLPSACWDMVNKGAVHILLECILVWHIVWRKLHGFKEKWTEGAQVFRHCKSQFWTEIKCTKLLPVSTTWQKNVIINYYRPQTKLVKVMFSQVSICPQGEECLPHCMLGYTSPRTRGRHLPGPDTP